MDSGPSVRRGRSRNETNPRALRAVISVRQRGDRAQASFANTGAGERLGPRRSVTSMHGGPRRLQLRLSADHAPCDQLIWTTYFFSHFSGEARPSYAFRDAMRAAGFTSLGASQESTGDRLWHYWSDTIRPADPDVLRSADRTAAATADAHGVRYDEWMIERDPSGELRPASAEDAARIETHDAAQREAAARFTSRMARGRP